MKTFSTVKMRHDDMVPDYLAYAALRLLEAEKAVQQVAITMGDSVKQVFERTLECQLGRLKRLRLAVAMDFTLLCAYRYRCERGEVPGLDSIEACQEARKWVEEMEGRRRKRLSFNGN